MHAQKIFEEFKLKKKQVNIMIYMLKAIHYCLQMYWKILEINVSKYMNLILLLRLRKTIEDQEIKQVGILKTLKPKELEKTKDKSDDNEKDLKYKEGFTEFSNKRIIHKKQR